MAIHVDATGLSCPQPVLLTRNALRSAGGDTVSVLVDSGTSRDNCCRVAEKAGWSVVIHDQGQGTYELVMSK